MTTMNNTMKLVKPYMIDNDGVAHYDEFTTVLCGDMTSVDAGLVCSQYPEGRIYSVHIMSDRGYGCFTEATVRFNTYDAANRFFKYASLKCKTVKEALDFNV